jgi:hypothetical protein
MLFNQTRSAKVCSILGLDRSWRQPEGEGELTAAKQANDASWPGRALEQP